jgi:hypothetical protein
MPTLAPAKKKIGEVFQEIASVKEANAKATRKRRVELLKEYDSFTVRVLIKQALDPRIRYVLPEGQVPFKPLVVPVDHAYTDLRAETRRLHYFLDPNCGGHASLNPRKREQLFISLLEGLHIHEAEILIAVKDKDLRKYGIDKALVEEAYPDLLSAPVLTGPSAGL